MLPLTHILACSTCGFDRSGIIGQAAENSILFLLVVTFAMLGMLGFVIFSFARKARKAASRVNATASAASIN